MLWTKSDKLNRLNHHDKKNLWYIGNCIFQTIQLHFCNLRDTRTVRKSDVSQTWFMLHTKSNFTDLVSIPGISVGNLWQKSHTHLHVLSFKRLYILLCISRYFTYINLHVLLNWRLFIIHSCIKGRVAENRHFTL